MKKNLHSRNEIVDAALLAWDESDVARESVYKQVERTLKENGIEAGGKGDLAGKILGDVFEHAEALRLQRFVLLVQCRVVHRVPVHSWASARICW